MGKGSNFAEDSENKTQNEKIYSWKEIKSNKYWIVINGKVYNVQNFIKKHPGGDQIIMNHATQDATDAFLALHNDMPKVNRYLKTLEVGRLETEDKNTNIVEESREQLDKDFRQLRELAEKMKLFEPNKVFFFMHLFSIITLELLGFLLIYYSGHSNWFTYILAAVLIATAQAQAGWLQHDLGHLSVFKSNNMNRLAHQFVMGTIKGVSASWWNVRHFVHHSKTNVIGKDEDIDFFDVFLLGKIIPREKGEKRFGLVPYHKYQHFWFLFIMPPLLLPVYFNIENFYHVIKTRNYREFFWMLTFAIRWYVGYGLILGLDGAFYFNVLFRFLESHWFVWVTQSSHIAAHMQYDNEMSWFRNQVMSTINIEQSIFNDWFTGHLNFQIEHHLFPTMPRHNYYKIKPYIQSLCKKYNIEYQEKPITRAMADYFLSLKDSGNIWYEAYNSH